MNHEHVTDRLSRHLHETAEVNRLRPGSEIAVVRSARRRDARRRQLTAASVVAVGGATAMGLVQLTGGTGSELRSGAAVDTPSTPDTATSPPITPQAAEGGVEFVESSMVWRVVRPDTSEAVGAGVWSRQSIQIPGVLLSTAPGRSDVHVPQLWRSDDGIRFAPTGTPPPRASLGSMIGTGDQLYAFGTAPAAAETGANRLVASMSEDGGTTWTSVDLLVEVSDAVHLPGLDVGVHVGSAAMTADGVLVVVQRNRWLDVEAYGIDAWLDQRRDGLVVPGDSCATGDHPDEMMEQIEAGAATVDPRYGCETKVIPWEEVGVSAALAERLREPRQTLLFAADGSDEFVEITAPSATAEYVSLPSGRHLVIQSTEGDGTTALHRLRNDLTWEHLPGAPERIGSITDFEGQLVVVPDWSVGASATVSILGDDGVWRSIDLSVNPGDRTISQITSGRPGLLAASWSAEIDEAALGPEPTTTVPTSDAPDTTIVTGLSDPRWELLHSVDGRTWSSESVAELAGVPAASISGVTRVVGVDDSFVVTVTLNPATAESIPEQLVLIGTLAG